MRRSRDWYVPVALACSVMAFLWLAYYLFLGPTTDQLGTVLPVTAICLNPLTLVFDHTDSLVGFSGLVLLSNALIYGAVGLLVRKAVKRLSSRKNQPLTKV